MYLGKCLSFLCWNVINLGFLLVLIDSIELASFVGWLLTLTSFY